MASGQVWEVGLLENVLKWGNGNKNVTPEESFENFQIGTLGHWDSYVMSYSKPRFRLGHPAQNDTADQRQFWALVRDFKTLEENDRKCGAL